jgi:predicted RNase H-like HicB family nuclease
MQYFSKGTRPPAMALTLATFRVVSTGKTLEQTRERMKGAMELHLRGMREDGDPIPEPSHVEMLEVV